MEKIKLKEIKKAHLIGIGGIGISAIARMMLLEGKKVSGSDRERSSITDELERLGAEIFIGHDAGHVPHDADVVVYTIAIPDDNPELICAKERGIPCYTYPQMLGIISHEKFTIAVSGTHGKTTTTGMIGTILIDAGLNPTVILGSLLKDVNSNFIVGKPETGKRDILVVEACEYRRSFLNLSPDILVITNIDADHLDYYKDLNDIIRAFSELSARIKKEGIIVTDKRHPAVRDALAGREAVDFETEKKGGVIELAFPGEYNQKNARAALAVATLLGVSEISARESLKHFGGTWRRFEHKGTTKEGAEVYDDYAHHPTEIQAMLKGARERFPQRKIIAVFQPHLYSRTKTFLNELAESFSDADEVILAPVYAARENSDAGVDTPVLAETMKEKKEDVLYCGDFGAIESYLKTNAKQGDVIITIGAGDIFKVGESLLQSITHIKP
ncbi:MAG: Mur ligase domain-containing protein [Candidatus Paceibacterota bacterium]